MTHRRLPILRRIDIAAVLVFAGAMIQAAPAQAATTLCSGAYATCIEAGYTAHGYDLKGDVSYWRMYAGHNCTNYAAYMAIQNGAGNPEYRLEVAKYWDDNAARSRVPVDGTPAVGAIAQWEANAGYASSEGHVAYVEAVDDTSITISEDNWSSGPFSWKRIARDSSDWPSHFIHFADVPVAQPSWNGVGGAEYVGFDHLSRGQMLRANQYLMSTDGHFVLMMQTDGNLVLYGPGYHVLWNARTGGNQNAHLVLQHDGNLVVYAANGSPKWWTGAHGIVRLWAQNDGNLVGRSLADSPMWTSGTAGMI